MWRFHSAFQPSNETIMEPLLTSSTVQGHQIPSSSTASALKPTVCGSAIAFSVNPVFSSSDRNRFAIKKGGQLVCDFAFRRYDTKWCPVSFGNSSASLRMCRLELEF